MTKIHKSLCFDSLEMLNLWFGEWAESARLGDDILLVQHIAIGGTVLHYVDIVMVKRGEKNA